MGGADPEDVKAVERHSRRQMAAARLMDAIADAERSFNARERAEKDVDAAVETARKAYQAFRAEMKSDGADPEPWLTTDVSMAGLAVAGTFDWAALEPEATPGPGKR
jgi:hypothetical protein